MGIGIEVEGLDGFAEEVNLMKFIWMDKVVVDLK